VLRAGGRIETNHSGEEVLVIPVLAPQPSALERSWAPGAIANSLFTDEEKAQLSVPQRTRRPRPAD
jgi:hypothetical protein